MTKSLQFLPQSDFNHSYTQGINLHVRVAIGSGGVRSGQFLTQLKYTRPEPKPGINQVTHF